MKKGIVTKRVKGTTKASIMSNLMAAVIIVCMTAAMSPVSVFADDPNEKVWGNGDTEEEKKSQVVIYYEGANKDNPDKINKITYKDGYYKPYEFVSYDDILGLNKNNMRIGLDELETLTKHELPKWAGLATKVFKSLSGDKHSTWKRVEAQLYNWSYYYECAGSGNKNQLNLADWFAYPEKRDQTNKSYHGALSYGLKHAKSLNEVRTSLADQIAKQIDGSTDRVLSQRSDGASKDGTLSQMKDTTPKDVFYVNVVNVEDFVASRTYNGYGVAFYDFEAVPVTGEGLNYPEIGEPDYKGTDVTPTDNSIEEPFVNQDTIKKEGKDGYHATHSVGTSLTDSNSFLQTNTQIYTLGAEGGVGIEWSPLKDILKISGSAKGAFSFSQACETAWGTEKSKTATDSDEISVEGALEPHSVMLVKQGDLVKSQWIKYNCPTQIRYKVAFYSISGDKPLVGDYGDTKDFCTKFGLTEKDSGGEGGYGAVENLHMRTQSAAAENAYGRTEGHFKPDLKADTIPDKELNWSCDELSNQDVPFLNKDSGKYARVPITDIIRDASKTIPMAGVGMEMRSDKHQLTSSKDGMALYKLEKIKLKDSFKSEYNMIEGRSFSLPNDAVEGADRDDIAYYGFDPSKGAWKVCDKDGNLIDENDSPLSITQDANGRFVITAEDNIAEEKSGWITWRLADGVKYTSYDGVTVDAQHDSGVTYPRIKVNIKKDIDGVNIDFEKSSAQVYAYEPAELTDILPVLVKKDGNIISHKENVTYELTDKTIPASDAAISGGTMFSATETGEYEVRAIYRDDVVSDTTAKVTVLEERKASAKVHPATVVMGVLSEDAVIDLDNYADVTVPYASYDPEIAYELEAGADGAEIVQDEVTGAYNKLKITKPGNYAVDVSEVGTYGRRNADMQDEQEIRYPLGTIDVSVSKEKAVDLPEAEDLIYNGKEQQGVAGSDDYTLENEKAVDAGRYIATVTPKKGCGWSDSGGHEARRVAYEIKRKPIDDPKVVKGLVYNGEVQTGVEEGEGYKVRGSRQMNAGKYNANAELEDNYIWNDLIPRDKMMEFEIAKAKVKVPKAKSGLVYKGKKQTGVSAGTGYTIKGNTATNAGSYNAKVQPAANYEWTDGTAGEKTVKFTVAKANNTLKASGKTVKLKAKSVKKKSKKIKASKAYKIKGAKGKVTYKAGKNSKKVKKRIKLSKNGDLTIKKKTKKGTYKYKVSVKAAGGSNYKTMTKNVTVTIKVK